MGSRDSPRPGSVPTWNKTKEDEKIELNRRQMGSLLLRKSEGLRGVSSGSIVKVNSQLFPACKWCLLTSDVFPAGEIQMSEYVVEFWNTSLSKSKRLKLKEIAHAQPNPCHRSKDGLVLIPIKISTSVFDKRRTFPTDYYDLEGSNEVKLHCYVVGSIGTNKDSLAGEAFTLMARTKKDHEGRPIKDGKGKPQYDYELRPDDNGVVCKTHKNFKTHLCPCGGVILKVEGLQATCIGVLNFSSEGLPSPVFFTRDTLTSQEQLFHPSSVLSTGAIANPDIKTQVDASPKEVDLETLKGQEKSNCEMKQRQIADQENRLLQKYVSANGYQIRQVNIPGDGNCLFHAVADQLKRLRVPGYTYESLRELAVKELNDNEKDNHLSMDLAAVVPNNDPAAYLQNMSCDGTWGDHMELVALSHALKKTIIVVTTSASEPKNAKCVIGDFPGSPVLLGHLCEYHYKSLEPLQSQTYDGQGSVTASETALSLRSPHSVVRVTGRNKATHPQFPATESGNPSLNEDATRCSTDYGFMQKEQLQNINFLTTQNREKCEEYDKKCEEYNQLQRNSEFDGQKIKHLNKQVSELRFDFRTIEKENEELRAENEELRAEKEELSADKENLLKENKDLHTKIKVAHTKINELIGQRASAVIGDDSSSRIGSNKVEEEEPPEPSANSRQEDSLGSNSSEEEFVDALTELSSTLD